MKQLMALNCEQAGELWGSVWGERLWHWLQGEDFDMSETDHLKSHQPFARAGAGDARRGEGLGRCAQATA